ncbi:MAG: isoleucine--tRNA ligase [Candidatus Aenigmarchaeota archaeon]|nr:isoleucine--tRNA ligase [Candidatus Aenigmarchaeota archaeon]
MEYNHKEIEKHVSDLWKQQHIPQTIVSMNTKGKKFYLLDGPPYVNGVPHVGHVKTTLFKDLWGKFKHMQGYAVWFQPGFDCGGLPIENKVEKELGIHSKTEIETKIGIARFIEACNTFAKGNESVWLDYYKNIGAWRGWLAPYLTSENYYVESGWWTIKHWFEQGLFVEGERPGFWCPHCETVLAGIEASESYKNVCDPSVYLKFPVKGRPHEYFLVWTTTPWTLPANVALLVHPDEYYVKVAVDDDVLILAEKRLSVLDNLGVAYVLKERLIGKEIAGMKYAPILDIESQREIAAHENSHQIYVSVPVLKKRVASKTLVKQETTEEGDEFGHPVTMDVGTGVVHTAPGHGDIDNKIGKHYNLIEYSPVDEKGRFTEKAKPFDGVFVKDADKDILAYLKKHGVLFHETTITHSYPLCWRCKTPLIYRMSRQWFLKLDLIREKIIKANKHVNWLPEFARERFHQVIEDAPDWAVTRQRYWGIPLPIWTCQKCEKKIVIGSREELRDAVSQAPQGEFDLHKHIVDALTISCSCGGTMHREKDIMDVWFDSGIAPWASLGYPFKNKDVFEKLWNIDLVDESQDQIRAWFYYMMLCSFATFDRAPYQTVCLNGWTLDEKGEKMSKSLGNVVFGKNAYEELGADTLRLYIAHDTAPWETQKFSLRNAKDLGKHLVIVWNTYQYFKTYGTITTAHASLQVEDRWILSRLATITKEITQELETFEFHRAARTVLDFFVSDVSRTYIKLVRDRADDAVNAVFTKIFADGLRMLSVFCPFISEYIYHDLFKQSVHLQSWTTADEKHIEAELEEQMIIVKEITEQVYSLRKDEGLKLRWPVAYLRICGGDVRISKLLKNYASVLADFANVKIMEEGSDGDVHKPFSLGTLFLSKTVLADEALLRETLREIQSKRKELGLVVSDTIVLTIDNKKLEPFKDEIAEKVGAKIIHFGLVHEATGIASFNDENVTFKIEVPSRKV